MIIDARTLRSARHAAGLTQAELASRIGMTERRINAYEAGAKIPQWTALALASVLKKRGKK